VGDDAGIFEVGHMPHDGGWSVKRGSIEGP
jgi:hypothetical protein